MEERRLGSGTVRVVRGPDGRSDMELLRAMRAGDDSAFGELWRRHEPDARRYARNLTGRTDVDDVVAEAFAKILRAIRQGGGPTDQPIRYVMVATRTAVYNAHQATARDRAALGSVGAARPTTAPIELYDEVLFEAVRSLPQRWRQILWWTEVEGMTVGEVSRRLSIAPAAAASLAYRARKALRAAYMGLEPDLLAG
jgi:RNA polymerase sigma factor (sigma-70 family)